MKALFRGSTALVTLMVAGSAFAQTTPPSAAASQDQVPATGVAEAQQSGQPSPSSPVQDPASTPGQVGIGDIIVTAERRSESLQRTPIAITAYTGQALIDRRIDRVEDLASITPSLQIFAEQVNNEEYIIRGIGRSNEDLTTDSGVAVYQNDVYLSQPSMANAAFFDVERVEVLRGPQGTLYGKNAVGGVLNIITRRPTEEFQGELIAEVGGLRQRKVTAAAGGPIVDGLLSGRVAFLSLQRNGAYRNLTTGQRANDIDSQAIRGSLRFTPTEALEINLIGDYSDSKQDGVLKSVISDSPGDAYVLKDFFIVDAFPTQETDIRSARSDLNGAQGVRTWGALARADYSLDAGTVSFLTAYRTETSFNSEDIDRTAQASNNFFADQDSWMTSQELRFVSDDDGALSFGGRFHWSAGLYWFHEQGRRSQSIFLNGRVPGSAPGDPDDPDNGLIGPGTPDAQNSTATFLQRINTDSYAAFGQAKYDITDSLGFTLGLRYTSERKDASLLATSVATIPGQDSFSLFQDQGPFFAEEGRTYKKLTPKAVLEYRLTDSINTYASYARGFKSGGSNGQAGTAEGFAPFLPETADNYEVGIKADLFGRRLRINTAAFYVDFKDLQVSGTNEQGQVITANASNARIKGIEVEATVQPVAGLTLRGSMSLLDATFQDYFVEEFDPTITDGPPFITVDKSGDRLDDVPKYAFNAGLDYRIDLSSGAQVRFGIDASFVSDTISNQNTLRASSYELVNGLIGITTPDKRWDFSVYVKNALDQDYYRGGGAVPDLNKQVSRVGLVADPRTAGVTLRLRFGDKP